MLFGRIMLSPQAPEGQPWFLITARVPQSARDGSRKNTHAATASTGERGSAPNAKENRQISSSATFRTAAAVSGLGLARSPKKREYSSIGECRLEQVEAPYNFRECVGIGYDHCVRCPQ